MTIFFYSLEKSHVTIPLILATIVNMIRLTLQKKISREQAILFCDVKSKNQKWSSIQSITFDIIFAFLQINMHVIFPLIFIISREL